MNERKLVKKCLICGDRAISNNFDALSCQSCKSFFRRNALRNKEFKCHYQNKCKIDIISRKFCQKCRLDKCFATGMKKEAILSAEERELRRREKRVLKSNTDFHLNNTQIMKRLKNSENREMISNKSLEIPTLIRQLIFTFNELEMTRLKELFSAITAMTDPMNTKIVSETNSFLGALMVFQMRCELKFRQIVKTSTNIKDFEKLCENDKIALLKASCPEIMLLISINTFNFDGEYWNIPINETNSTIIKLDTFKYVRRDLYEAHRNFLLSLREQYNSDINILHLLFCILLFNPRRQNLIHKDIVKELQEKYIHLLQRYLELKYNSKCESESKYVGLMNNLQDLYALNQLIRNKFTERAGKPECQLAGPFIAEIYDMEKQNTKK